MLCYNLFFFQVHYKLFHQESSKEQGLHWFRKSENIVTTGRCNHIQILDLRVPTHTHTTTICPTPTNYISQVYLSIAWLYPMGSISPLLMTCKNIIHQDPETSGLLSEESIYQTDRSGGQTKQQYTASNSKQIIHFLSVLKTNIYFLWVWSCWVTPTEESIYFIS
jgi:hypothetical protein